MDIVEVDIDRDGSAGLLLMITVFRADASCRSFLGRLIRHVGGLELTLIFGVRC